MTPARVQTRKQFFSNLFPIVCLSCETTMIIIYGLKRALVAYRYDDVDTVMNLSIQMM